MKVTVFSAFMAVIFGDIIILLIHLLRRKPAFLKHFGVSAILFLYGVCAFRMVFAFELPFTQVVEWRWGLNGFYQAAYYNTVSVASQDISLVTLAGLIWLLVGIVLIGSFLIRYFLTQRRVGKYRQNHFPAADKVLRNIQKESDSEIKVSVFVCPETDIPMSLGILDRKILLPREDYAPDELYYILRHEFTHLSHRDTLMIFLARLFCRVFWWNPFSYVLCKDVLQMVEIKCDLSVTDALDRREVAAYLSTIVNLLKESNGRKNKFKVASAQLFKDKRDFSTVERFNMVTQPKNAYSKRALILFWTSFFVLLLASYSFVLQPGWDPSREDISENGHYVETNPENAYLLRHKDGTWSFVLGDGTSSPISEENAEIFIEDGIDVRKE